MLLIIPFDELGSDDAPVPGETGSVSTAFPSALSSPLLWWCAALEVPK